MVVIMMIVMCEIFFVKFSDKHRDPYTENDEIHNNLTIFAETLDISTKEFLKHLRNIHCSGLWMKS